MVRVGDRVGEEGREGESRRNKAQSGRKSWGGRQGGQTQLTPASPLCQQPALPPHPALAGRLPCGRSGTGDAKGSQTQAPPSRCWTEWTVTSPARRNVSDT